MESSAGFEGRGNWVRLKTLVNLRWLAISGQTAAIVAAWQVYGIRIDAPLCLAVVGLAVVMNLLSATVFSQTRRLSEVQTLAVLLFDTAQLGILLYLTGGLNNPFALLILAPATIAAAALNNRSTVVVGLLAVATVTFLFWYHRPLIGVDGAVIAVPQLFGFGFWLAIVIGVLFLAIYARRVSSEIHAMGDALLATQMALARERKLTDLSGIVAAAAHELGTPLATIKLASSELIDELADRPDLSRDAELILDQADRCRDILRSMGQAGTDDLHMRSAPFAAVVQEAAEPHIGRRADVRFAMPTNRAARQPVMERRPEIIHGLRNLVQNAVDFARTSVWIDIDWTPAEVLVVISDDGPGYPPTLLPRIGDPYMRPRRTTAAQPDGREHYEGMGLGLFIAKTLLERTGAELTFANGSDPFLTENERPERRGAIVSVRWQRAQVEGMISADPGDGPPPGDDAVFSARDPRS